MKSDTRNFTRKPVRGQSLLIHPNGERYRGRIKDLSLGGVCVLLPEQVAVGLDCKVALETVHNGQVVHLVASAKVVYCILSGTDGFRTGLQFAEIDAANNKLLAELMI